MVRQAHHMVTLSISKGSPNPRRAKRSAPAFHSKLSCRGLLLKIPRRSAAWFFVVNQRVFWYAFVAVLVVNTVLDFEFLHLDLSIAGSANGRQAGSEPVNLGSNPSPAASPPSSYIICRGGRSPEYSEGQAVPRSPSRRSGRRGAPSSYIICRGGRSPRSRCLGSPG